MDSNMCPYYSMHSIAGGSGGDASLLRCMVWESENGIETNGIIFHAQFL